MCGAALALTCAWYQRMPDPTYRITTTRGVIRLRSDNRRNAILSALELHGPGATLIRVEIEGEWE